MSHRARPWVLGFSTGHNAAMCLLHGEEVVVAIQEERLSRQKRAGFIGTHCCALPYCLETAGISIEDLDLIVGASSNDYSLHPTLGFEGSRCEIEIIPHYLAHAHAAFASSGFDDAAILVVDGGGEFVGSLRAKFPEELAGARFADIPPVPEGRGEEPCEIVGLYHGQGAQLTMVEKHIGIFQIPMGKMPGFGSLGGMFSSVAQLLFGDPFEAGQVMGLAPYGRPLIPADDFVVLADGHFTFYDSVPRSHDRHARDSNVTAWQRDLAASVQVALERALLGLWERARVLTGSRRIAYVGGVALNCVANQRLIRCRLFDNHAIMPAAEDSGTALGAAYWGSWRLAGRASRRPLRRDDLGRSYARPAIDEAIVACPFVQATPVDDIVKATVDALVSGRAVGWFGDSGAELGPRALGHRSILLDPRRPDGKAVLNARVKHRAAFRPFAPMVLLEHFGEWFETEPGEESPHMLRTFHFRPERAKLVPAVVHVDGTGRVQTVDRVDNPRLHALLVEFASRTGVPILLNTSFNVAGEPIVESPADALWCLLFSDLDIVVFDGIIARRRAGLGSVVDLPFALRPAVHMAYELRDGSRVVVGTGRYGPRFARLEAHVIRFINAALSSGNQPVTARQLLPNLQQADEEAWDDWRAANVLSALFRADLLEFRGLDP